MKKPFAKIRAIRGLDDSSRLQVGLNFFSSKFTRWQRALRQPYLSKLGFVKVLPPTLSFRAKREISNFDFTTVHFFWGLTHGILHSTFQAQE